MVRISGPISCLFFITQSKATSIACKTSIAKYAERWTQEKQNRGLVLNAANGVPLIFRFLR